MKDEKVSAIVEIMNMSEHFYDPECGDKYKELAKLINKHDTIIQKSLENNSELLQHYKTVYTALEQYESMNNEDHYIAGFIFGFKLAMEICE